MLIRIWIQAFCWNQLRIQIFGYHSWNILLLKTNNHSFVDIVFRYAFSVNAVLQEIIEAETSSSAVLSFPYSIHQPINEEGDKEPLVGEGTK
jgi:hypothetical protein